MASINLADLRSVRDALGKSQGELAKLLGASKRAVQSYEQGWRPVPAHIQKSAALLLFLNWRRNQFLLGRKCSPCWVIRKCTAAVRAKCSVFKFGAGDLCWLLTGARCHGRTEKSWEAKMARCRSCEVMRQWLKPAPACRARKPAPPGQVHGS